MNELKGKDEKTENPVDAWPSTVPFIPKNQQDMELLSKQVTQYIDSHIKLQTVAEKPWTSKERDFRYYYNPFLSDLAPVLGDHRISAEDKRFTKMVSDTEGQTNLDNIRGSFGSVTIKENKEKGEIKNVFSQQTGEKLFQTLSQETPNFLNYFKYYLNQTYLTGIGSRMLDSVLPYYFGLFQAQKLFIGIGYSIKDTYLEIDKISEHEIILTIKLAKPTQADKVVSYPAHAAIVFSLTSPKNIEKSAISDIILTLKDFSVDVENEVGNKILNDLLYFEKNILSEKNPVNQRKLILEKLNNSHFKKFISNLFYYGRLDLLTLSQADERFQKAILDSLVNDDNVDMPLAESFFYKILMDEKSSVILKNAAVNWFVKHGLNRILNDSEITLDEKNKFEEEINYLLVRAKTVSYKDYFEYLQEKFNAEIASQKIIERFDIDSILVDKNFPVDKKIQVVMEFLNNSSDVFELLLVLPKTPDGQLTKKSSKIDIAYFLYLNNKISFKECFGFLLTHMGHKKLAEFIINNKSLLNLFLEKGKELELSVLIKVSQAVLIRSALNSSLLDSKQKSRLLALKNFAFLEKKVALNNIEINNFLDLIKNGEITSASRIKIKLLFNPSWIRRLFERVARWFDARSKINRIILPFDFAKAEDRAALARLIMYVIGAHKSVIPKSIFEEALGIRERWMKENPKKDILTSDQAKMLDQYLSKKNNNNQQLVKMSKQLKVRDKAEEILGADDNMDAEKLANFLSGEDKDKNESILEKSGLYKNYTKIFAENKELLVEKIVSKSLKNLVTEEVDSFNKKNVSKPILNRGEEDSSSDSEENEENDVTTIVPAQKPFIPINSK